MNNKIFKRKMRNEKIQTQFKSSLILYISEFFGTFLLAYSICVCTHTDINGNQSTDMAKFLVMLALILSICNTLGTADLNPAVSYLKYAIMKDKRKQHTLWSMLPSYILLQYLASITGFYIAHHMNNDLTVRMSINPMISSSNAFIMETYSSLVLYLVIAVLEHTVGIFNELAIKVFATVLGVGSGIAMGSTTSGAGLNPAIVTGASFVRFLHTGAVEEFKYLWLYTIGPFLASYLVGKFYNNLYTNEKFYIKSNLNTLK